MDNRMGEPNDCPNRLDHKYRVANSQKLSAAKKSDVHARDVIPFFSMSINAGTNAIQASGQIP
jgi:hypothetical protein